MKYFTELPKVSYNLKFGTEQTTLQLTSINTRVTFTELTRATAKNFYPYVMDAGERPDQISDIYYRSPDRYWLVMLSNTKSDMYYDFGLSEQAFQRYLIAKYEDDAGGSTWATVSAYLQSTVKYYKDADGDNIDSDTYDALDEADRSTQSLYDWELANNDSNREIQLVSAQYVTSIERQFKDLMKTK